ncbi:MAG: N-acetylmuramoyl-L-alanine amidase [bacterium]
MPRVIISAGHTEQSPGSQANGFNEHLLSRSIARKVLPYIRRSGVISLSVPPNLDLVKRLEWVNKTGYNETTNDVIVEIHINDGGNRGIEVWYEGRGGNPSQTLAEIVLKATALETGLPEQGAKSEFEHELGSIAFLHESLPISIIIECGYLDNEEDAAFLREEANLEKAAKGIAKGILQYLNVPFQENIPVPTPVAVSAPKPIAEAKDKISPVRPIQPVTQTQIMSPAPVNNFQPSTTPLTPSNDSNFKPLPSREERKNVIRNLYIKILGREPNQNDLNYFLNVGIKEEELIKKMIDSQEHADLVKARQEVFEAKKKFNDQNTDYLRLQTKAKDQDTILYNLQQTINQKNLAIQTIQAQLNRVTQEQQTRVLVAKKRASNSAKYKGSFIDKVFKAFSDIFE